ncbi:IS3 family transposase [Synechococcus sp. BSF8S]|uniref:IS3 family transposase n=1 Tax=Synechococcales TaxID=1890424 RepID=UPI00351C0054
MEAWLCRRLGVAENSVLTAEIQAVFQDGVPAAPWLLQPPIHQELGAAGHLLGRHRVARLMQQAELRARTRKPCWPCSRASRGATGVIGALNRPLGLRRVEPETMLLHTDQGSPVSG